MLRKFLKERSNQILIALGIGSLSVGLILLFNNQSISIFFSPNFPYFEARRRLDPNSLYS